MERTAKSNLGPIELDTDEGANDSWCVPEKNTLVRRI
jgi:hypothetical protein